MTAAVATKYNLKLWQIDFVGAYLNSLTKEDIYMKQPEGLIKPGFKDHVCKLIHTIYGTMQGGHDWYETLSTTFNIPSPAQIHVFNSKRRTGTTQLLTPILMTFSLP